MKPIAITFCIRTIRSEFADKFKDTDKGAFMKKLPCEFWAQDYYMMTETTISNYISATPMHPMVALEYVLTNQEQNLISLEYKDDPTVKMLYAIARDTLKHNLGEELDILAALIESCQQNQKQYKKIIDALKDDGNRSKRVLDYALDGVLYTESCLRKYQRQLSSSCSPMPERVSLKKVYNQKGVLFERAT
ncbi:hypothetical protein BDC45DRAFT_498725 [Circinella umbellata]|nr:hypothetical protein BDC45DRAFT_498725 [Circinella umbellata]